MLLVSIPDTLPESACSSPIRILKSVVFPMPEVPIRQYIELSLRDILTFLRTSLSSKVLHKSVIIILTIILLTF